MENHELVCCLVLSGQVPQGSTIVDNTTDELSKWLSNEVPVAKTWQVDRYGETGGNTHTTPIQCIISDGVSVGSWLCHAWQRLTFDGIAMVLKCSNDQIAPYIDQNARGISFGPPQSAVFMLCKDEQRLHAFAEHMNAFYRRLEALGPAAHNYEEHVRALLINTIKPGWSVIDVGAHVGAHTIVMAQLVGQQGRVFAFDAHPKNVSDLKLNAVNFGVQDRTTVEWCAVTDGSSSTVIMYHGRNDWSAEWNMRGIDVSGNKTEAAMEVKALSLDTYLPDATVQFVKIDVEGAANGVVRGMKSLIQRNRPTIFMEFHGDGELEALRELVAMGYSMRDASTGAPVTPEMPAYHILITPN